MARRRPLSPTIDYERLFQPVPLKKSKQSQSVESMMEMGQILRTQPIEDPTPTPRRHLCITFFAIILVLLLLFAIVVLFLYPRPVQIVIKTLTDTSDDHYSLSTFSNQVTINITHVLECILDNPNFYPVTLKQIAISGYWILTDHRKQFVNQDVPSITLGPRQLSTILMPYSVEFTADPRIDPMYLSFMSRCSAREKAARTIQLDYVLKAVLSYLGVKREHTLDYSYRTPCPISPDQISEILSAAGVDPNTLPREISANLQNSK